MSLYLKYRPKTLTEMVGQRHIIDILLAQAKQGKFSSSYLLYGPRGTGKTSTARLLAKLVNSTTTDADGNPDIVNDPAVAVIDAGKTLDYVEIDAASHTGVDNIREEIIDKALYPPTSLKTKVYVIDEVHMLSKGAFNALLKIMEEPKPYLKFVLATTEINKVPDTIISRCQVFNFKHMSLDELSGRLEYIAQQEGFEYDNEALRLIAKLSNGGMRDAIKYLEQVSILGAITQEHVAQFLGVVSSTKLASLMDAVVKSDYNAIISILDELVSGGTDLYALVKDMLLYCDDHFMDDPSFYAPLTGMLQEISADMKWYPHPLLVWKRKFYKMCEEKGGIVSSSRNLGSDTVTPSTPSSTEPKSTSNSGTTSESTSNNISQGEINAPEPVQKNEDSEPVITAPKTQSPSTSGSVDFGTLMEKIVDKVEKVMIRSALKQHTTVKSLENGVLELIVINEQFHNVLQKPETVEYLNSIVQGIIGDDSVTVKATYMSKEEFMMQGL